MKQLIEDDRFKSLFEDKDFVRDKNSSEYKQMKPVSHLFFSYVWQTVTKEDSSDDEANAPRKGLNSLFAGGDSSIKETKQAFGEKVSSKSF